MHFPRLLRLRGCAECREHGAKRKDCDFSLHVFLSAFIHLALETRDSPLVSLEDLIRPREHIWWNCQTDLFRSFQIDDKLKLRCLLHGQISRFRSLENLVHVNSRATIEVNEVSP